MLKEVIEIREKKVTMTISARRRDWRRGTGEEELEKRD